MIEEAARIKALRTRARLASPFVSQINPLRVQETPREKPAPTSKSFEEQMRENYDNLLSPDNLTRQKSAQGIVDGYDKITESLAKNPKLDENAAREGIRELGTQFLQFASTASRAGTSQDTSILEAIRESAALLFGRAAMRGLIGRQEAAQLVNLGGVSWDYFPEEWREEKGEASVVTGNSKIRSVGKQSLLNNVVTQFVVDAGNKASLGNVWNIARKITGEGGNRDVTYQDNYIPEEFDKLLDEQQTGDRNQNPVRTPPGAPTPREIVREWRSQLLSDWENDKITVNILLKMVDREVSYLGGLSQSLQTADGEDRSLLEERLGWQRDYLQSLFDQGLFDGRIGGHFGKGILRRIRKFDPQFSLSRRAKHFETEDQPREARNEERDSVSSTVGREFTAGEFPPGHELNDERLAIVHLPETNDDEEIARYQGEKLFNALEPVVGIRFMLDGLQEIYDGKIEEVMTFLQNNPRHFRYYYRCLRQIAVTGEDQNMFLALYKKHYENDAQFSARWGTFQQLAIDAPVIIESLLAHLPDQFRNTVAT